MTEVLPVLLQWDCVPVYNCFLVRICTLLPGSIDVKIVPTLVFLDQALLITYFNPKLPVNSMNECNSHLKQYKGIG